MIGGRVNLTKRVSLGVFVPSNFSDREWLFEILDKRLNEIDIVCTPSVGENIVLEWCLSRNRPIFLHPIKGGYNLIEAFAEISKVVDKICIVDNGCSESAVKLANMCEEKELDYKVLECKTVIEELNCARERIAELEKKLTPKKRGRKKKDQPEGDGGPKDNG